MKPNYHAVLFGNDNLKNEILANTLEGFVSVQQFGDDSEFQETNHSITPDLFIIHKSLSKGDGIIACENLRSLKEFHHSSILLILESDSVYQKIKCYEAGADDYIVQPYHPEEIVRKVKNLSNRSAHQKESAMLAEKATSHADDATKTAFEAMKATSDLGLILKFMKSCQAAMTLAELADQLYMVTSQLGISAVIQICGEEGYSTFSQNGDVRPIEKQLLREAKDKGRVVEDESFLIVNFELISLLVNDLPTDDLSHGRIKDTLVQLIGAAEIRVRSIMVSEILHAQSRETISVINLIRQIASDNHKHSMAIMKRLTEDIELSAVSLGLTEEQEEHFTNLANKAHIDLDTLYNGSEVLESHFMRVILGVQKAINMQEGTIISMPES